MEVDEDARTAVMYSHLNGVTRPMVCERFGYSVKQLRQLRKDLFVYPGRSDFVLACLTHSGELMEGELPSMLLISQYVDWQNRDGCGVDEVGEILDRHVEDGLLVIADGRWRLTRRWPDRVSPL